jgi:hypothetical protein
MHAFYNQAHFFSGENGSHRGASGGWDQTISLSLALFSLLSLLSLYLSFFLSLSLSIAVSKSSTEAGGEQVAQLNQ